MKWTTDPPERGDIVRVKVSFYYHYGIFVDDEHVVQFGLPDNSQTPPEAIAVCVTDVYAFMHGGMLETGVPSRQEAARRRGPDETVRLAMSRVGETGYDILRNNCEHFANACAFTEARPTALDGLRAAIRRKLKRD